MKKPQAEIFSFQGKRKDSLPGPTASQRKERFSKPTTSYFQFPAAYKAQPHVDGGGTHRGMVPSAKSTQHKNHRTNQEERTYYTRLSCDGFS